MRKSGKEISGSKKGKKREKKKKKGRDEKELHCFG